MERIENKYINLQCAICTCQKIALFSYRDKAEMPISKT